MPTLDFAQNGAKRFLPRPADDLRSKPASTFRHLARLPLEHH